MKEWKTDNEPDRLIWVEAAFVGTLVASVYVSLIYDTALRLIAWFD